MRLTRFLQTVLSVAIGASAVIAASLTSLGLKADERQPEQLKEPVTRISKDGELESPLTVLFGKVKMPTPGGPESINVRAYGLERPKRRDRRDTQPLVPGPTFVFRPGDLVKIHLENYLNRSSNPALNNFEDNPQESGPGQADDIRDHVAHEISIPNNADITNLHVHGLHVDPKQDNVTLLVIPEDSNPSSLVPELQRLVPTINRWWTRPYKYQIPADHVPGTFWYHSHKHGSTSTQVENGMAGTLVMLPRDDADDIVPGLWNDDPEKTHDRVMVLQEIANFGVAQQGARLPGSGRGAGQRGSQGRGGRETRAIRAQQGAPAQGPFQNPNNLTNPVTTINGQYQPELKLPAGQLERWRFVIAGANHTTNASLWVGKIQANKMGEEFIKQIYPELEQIKTRQDANAYIQGQKPKQFANAPQWTYQYLSVPGKVKLVAVDGIPLWQAVEITPSTPTLGGAGNRQDLLIQLDETAEKQGGWGVYQNYPLPPLEDLADLYPELFGAQAGEAASARYAAITQGTMMNGKSPLASATSVPNLLNQDPYALGTNYTGMTAIDGKTNMKGWTNVDENGNPILTKATDLSVPIGPLLSAIVDPANNGVAPQIRSQIFAPGSIGWQPMPDATGPLPPTAALLIKLKVTGKPSGPKMPTDAALNARLTQLSPASHDPGKTRLKKLNRQGQLVTGIPSYVDPAFPDRFDGHRTVVYDRGQFTFSYTDKVSGTSLQFRQFWINGRQFSPDDSLGNPNAQALIQSPLVNVEPTLGSYSPNAAHQTWTHQVGQGAAAKLLITNPGYYLPIKLNPDQTLNYDYAQAENKPPTYKDVTGLPQTSLPVSTTAEEWLLINNSDLYHPFHIHISPFFVEDIGQLNYDATNTAAPWSLKTLADSNSPFKWVAGNWWDVIVIPPHGYVKFKTWINVPDQLPENTDNPNSSLIVKENANVYGSWVQHCHILRHEDRGMMTMVNTTPKLMSLTGTWSGIELHGQGQLQNQNYVVKDDHGLLNVAPDPNPSKLIISGNFNEGLGNPFNSEPWAGYLQFPGNAVNTFCATDDRTLIVFSNGSVWTQNAKLLPGTVVPVPINLSGAWVDDDGNVMKISQTPGNTPQTFGELKFTPPAETPVWWSAVNGSWPAGVVPPVPPPPQKPTVTSANAYAGTQTLINKSGRSQQLSFCVALDGKTIVFGNGIKWTFLK